LRRVATLAGLVLVALCLLAVSSAAGVPRPGSLDPSFGSGGVVAHTGDTGVGAVAVQPDGRIVVLADGRLYRLLPDGSPDPTFDNTGFPARVGVDALALQPDGKIVVAGSYNPSVYSPNEFAVARYNPDGSPDESFGTDGITTTPGHFDWGASANAIAVLPGGGIVAAGSDHGDPDGEGTSFILARYTPAGALDPNFGHGGVVETFFSGIDELAGIVVLPSGKIVATGTGEGDGHGDDESRMVLARYKRDGSLDSSFGTHGRVISDGQLDWVGGPSALQDEKIVVAGSVLARFTANGRLDKTFGKSGFAPFGSVSNPHFRPVAVQADGRILTFVGNHVIRLTPNGQPDTSFGTGGVVHLGNHGRLWSLALQGDMKILVGGGNAGSWTLTRLVGGPTDCVVPRVSGETIAEATDALRKSHCTRGAIGWYTSSTLPLGRVMYTVPARGAVRPRGYAVELVVSEGKP
jgi:uncharacterized delta-60 repeat protein